MICALLLAACATAAQPATDNWRLVATEADQQRLRHWRRDWVAALANARAAGHDGEIAREGALLDPDAAQDNPVPPAGDYNCRTLKLGSRANPLAYVAYPAFHCRIAAEGGGLRFVKLTGSQRPIGRFYADRDLRMIFLGTMQLADEERAYQYGIDGDRDMIGQVERIGDRRWRIALPSPRFESMFDVIELTPR